MAFEIDGNYTIEELESAIQNKEAAANELTGLDNNGDTKNPQTLGTFKKLGPGKRPKNLHLVESDAGAPAAMTLICSGTVFIKGEETEVSAFREN